MFLAREGVRCEPREQDPTRGIALGVSFACSLSARQDALGVSLCLVDHWGLADLCADQPLPVCLGDVQHFGGMFGRTPAAGQQRVFFESGCAHRYCAWGGGFVLFGMGDWWRLFTSVGLVADFAVDALLCAPPQGWVCLDVGGIGHAVGHGVVQPIGMD